MPRIQCPGCGKEHEVVDPLREPKKFCLRCRETFVVSPDRLQYSPAEMVEKTKYAMATQDAKASSFEENASSDLPNESERKVEMDPPPSARPKSSKHSLKSPVLKWKKRDEEESDFQFAPEDEPASEDSDPRMAENHQRHSTPRVVWVLLTGGLAAVGVAGYFFLVAPSNEPSKMKTAALPSQPPPAATSTDAKDAKDKDTSLKETAKSEDPPISQDPSISPEVSPAQPYVKPETSKPEAPAIKISAARLAAEWTMDADLAKKKYQSKFLQVTGLFDRWADAKSPRGLFAVDGPAICFVLPKLLAARRARAELQPGRPITVRGRFSATVPAPFSLPQAGGEGGAGETSQPAPTPSEQEGTLASPPAQEGRTKETSSSPTAAENKGTGKPTIPDPLTAGGKNIAVGDFFLKDAEILPLSPPADDIYLKREMELSGHVVAVIPSSEKSEYPILRLERETNCRVDNDCLFPKTDEPELRKLSPGSFVTLSCTCSGRALRRKDEYYVRFDNCRVIYTTAPASSQIVRLPVAEVLRDYGEDLRTALPPAFDSNPNVKTITAAQLAKEFKQDSKAFEKSYRNKVIVVAGKLYRKGDQNVILDTGQTDNPLKIQCFFSRQAFLELKDGQDFTIWGLCGGLTMGQTLRLDNCQSIDSVAKTEQLRLTVDYLPSKPGQVFVYDVATLPLDSKAGVLTFRKVFAWMEGGIVERTVSHAGRLPKGRNLTDPDVFKDWIALKTTKKYSQSEPPLRVRVFGGFIEIGQEFISLEGQKSLSWDPVIKLGVKKGESWEWTRGSQRHQCKIIDIRAQENGGRGAFTRRSTATIREAITDLKRPDALVEITHVYVKDLGEVEREEAARLPNGQMKVISLMKLVEDDSSRAQEDRSMQTPTQKAPVGKVAIDSKDSKAANKDK
jgi:hypothetical protein